MHQLDKLDKMYTLSAIKRIQLPSYYFTVISEAKFLNIKSALLVRKCQ